MPYEPDDNGVWGTPNGIPARCCKECDDRFWPRFQWATVCYNCYLENKGETSPRMRRTHEEHDTTGGAGAKRSRRDWQEFPGTTHQDADPVLRLPAGQQKLLAEWPDMIPKLIHLTHPDKHDNSQLSNFVTQWLLEIREEYK